jgi:Mg-chelatase subunit ChlD
MTFANPWGLLALVGIPLVILLHRASREHPHTVPLVGLWAPAAAPVAGARRRRLDAILLLRLLVVTAVALGLARPGWSLPAPPRHVVVLDASASMGARDGQGSRFQTAVAGATRLLAELDPAAPVMLVRAGAGARVEHAFTADRTALGRALAQLSPGEASKDLDGALDVAAGALGPEGGIVDLFSDARDVPAVLDRARRLGLREADIRLHPVGHAVDNVAIVGLEAAPQPQSPLDYWILARVANFSGGPRPLTVSLGAQGLARQTRSITLDAGEVRPIVFESPAAAWLEARLEHPGDALAADDRAVLTLGEARLRVVYVPHAPRGDRFLETALAAHPGLRIRRVAADGLAALTPADADVLVLDGVTPPPAVRLPALVVHRGRPAETGAVPVVGWADRHPLLRRLDLGDVVVPARAVLAAGGEAAAGQTLIRSADGPVARASERDGVRRIDLSFGVDRSTLGQTPAFPAFMARALAWLADRGAAPTGVRAGQPARVAVPGAPDAVTIRRPDGATTVARPEGGHVDIVGTERTGLYRVEGPGISIPVAVNLLDADESNLARAAIPVPAPASFPAGPSASARVELARALLAAALALLTFETWLTHRRRRGLSPGSALRRGAAWLCLAVALASPFLVWGGAREPVVLLVDISASAARPLAATARRVRELAAAVAAEGPLGVVAFGATPTLVAPPGAPRARVEAELARLLARPEERASAAERAQTDIAAALRLGASLLPAGGRLALVSDGRQTRGDAGRAARAFGRPGIAIDVAPLAAAEGVDAAVEDVETPAQTYDGLPFELRATVRSTAPGPVRVALLLDGRTSAHRTLEAGRDGTRVRFTVTAPTAGAHRVGLRVGQAGDVEPRNDASEVEMFVLGPPRILWVGTSDPPAVTAARLVGARPAGLGDVAKRLGDFDAVVLDDVDHDALPAAFVERLPEFVRRGGGLLMLGGSHAFAPGGYRGTAVERVLPVDLDPGARGTRTRLALVIALDKSGSMAETAGGRSKIAAAREAVLTAARLLEPGDRLGVVAFDTEARAAVAIGERPGEAALRAVVERLTPRGGTRLGPALAEAEAMLGGLGAWRRHVVLVTDGRGEGGDLAARARALARAGVTLSTIAVGDDADARLLADLARAGGGRFEHAAGAGHLGAALRREVVLARGPVLHDRPTGVTVVPNPALDAGERPPAIHGWVSVAPRPGAAVALRTDGGDPLLALAGAGLGRSAALMTDLAGPWTAAWRAWPGRDALLARVLVWILRAPVDGRIAIGEEPARGGWRLTVRAEDAEGNPREGLALVARLADGEGRTSVVRLEHRGLGAYAAPAILAPPRPVAVRLEDRSSTTPRPAGSGWIGLDYAEEYRIREPDRALLDELRRLTGGRWITDASTAAPPPRTRARVSPTLPLAVAALALFLLDVVATRGARA